MEKTIPAPKGERDQFIYLYLQKVDGDVKCLEGRFDRFELKMEKEIGDLKGEVRSGHELLLGEIKNMRREVKSLKNRPFCWPKGMALVLLGTNVFLMVVVFEILFYLHG